MNAIIALCHFCEVHGPSVIFCTQTLRDTKLEDLNLDNEVDSQNCLACSSMDKSMIMLSKDDESNANFISTHIPIFEESVALVKQAAVRSLSCEVNSNKNGGLIFFGDSTRGHTLSHIFQLRDSQARGFHRLFSIIVLMKDKLFLLNIQPFLAEQLESISNKLQEYSSSIYAVEQNNISERSQFGESNSGNQLRSLIDLTGKKHIYALLHSHFSWILWSGARYLTESVPIEGPGIKDHYMEKLIMINLEKQFLLKHGITNSTINSYEESVNSFKHYHNMLGSDFTSLCYCILVGINVVLRGPNEKTIQLINCLRKILPQKLHHLFCINSDIYFSSNECKILSILPNVAVPQPNSEIFRLDFVSDKITKKWLGEVPSKPPTLLRNIAKAINEIENNIVLEKHIKVLIEEWKNKVLCLKKISSPQDQNKLKTVLGIQSHDQSVVNYWINYL